MSWRCGGISSRNAYTTTIERFFFKDRDLRMSFRMLQLKDLGIVTMKMRDENTRLERSWRKKEKTRLEKEEI